MNSMTDKLKGATNQVVGAVKESVGHAVGNAKLQADGSAQKLKGVMQEVVGDAKDAAKKGGDPA